MKWLSWLFKKSPLETVSLDEPISDGVTLGDVLKGLETRLKVVEQGFWRIDKRLQRAGIIPPDEGGGDKEKAAAATAAVIGPPTGVPLVPASGAPVVLPQEGDDLTGLFNIPEKTQEELP